MTGPADKKPRASRKRFSGAYGDGARSCDQPGCTEPGEYRAPVRDYQPNASGDNWRYLCLEHVRAFNAGYNYFDGMDEERIYEEQHPLHGWSARTTWADGRSPPPRWADFSDPLDAIGARFRTRAPRQAPDGSPLSDADAKALKILGLDEKADRKSIRRAYSAQLRRFHPDRNGGDRSHEAKLQKVVEAYQRLKKSAAFG